MEPIVNGLEDEYGTDIEFLRFNAKDNADGQAYFEQLSLLGHPGIVIFDTAKAQVYRGVGVIDEATLRDEIEQLE